LALVKSAARAIEQFDEITVAGGLRLNYGISPYEHPQLCFSQWQYERPAARPWRNLSLDRHLKTGWAQMQT
jgi:hypothetical protein